MGRAFSQQGITVVELDSRYDGLDQNALEDLSELLIEQVEAQQKPRLVLDFSQTKYFSSMGIDVLIRCWKRLRQRDGQMALCHLSEFCADVLHVVRLDTIWHIEPTREAAIAWIAQWPDQLEE